MSQENAEIVRHAYEAWNEGHFETLVQALDPDVELHLPEGGINVGIRRGRKAFREFLEDFLDVWGDLTAEPESVFVAGEQVVVFLRSHSGNRKGKWRGDGDAPRPSRVAEGGQDRTSRGIP